MVFVSAVSFIAEATSSGLSFSLNSLIACNGFLMLSITSNDHGVIICSKTKPTIQR